MTRLKFEIDHVHGRPLGPSIMTLHVQLAWRNWMVVQLDSGETESIAPPDFGAGLSMLETQNNFMWLPSVTNVPMLLNASPRQHLWQQGHQWERVPQQWREHPPQLPQGQGSHELLMSAARSGIRDVIPCSPRTPRSLEMSGPVA
jgi:hypothetical protein